MIRKNFMDDNNPKLVFFTGEKVYPEKRDKKLHYVMGRYISFDELNFPKIVKFKENNQGKSDKDLNNYYIPLNDIQDEERYHLIKLCWQQPLELG